MVFSSSLFLLFFFPLFFITYYLVSKRFKNYTFLAGSLFFYSWGAPKFVFVIVLCSIASFYLVRFLHQTNDIKTKRWLLFFSVFINLGMLVYFKYSNFFIENVNVVFNELGFTQLKWIPVILPIGISFYTFQSLTYTIDVYRKIHNPLEKASDYLLYILAFPHMIAGPIVRFEIISEQITNRIESLDGRLIGFYRFCIGLAKKVLIANVLAEQADLIFNSNLLEIQSATAWLGILAYTFQIYFDFAGYSDMAIGLAKMIGFQFPENFKSPYTAKNITEFWRKWHITLGTFMRNYLYIPLGGNKVDSKFRLYFNLIVVFLLSGLWHGAAWNFVIWGAFHGVLLILDRLFLIKAMNKLGTLVSTIITFFLVMMAWVIFRLEEVDKIVIYFKKLFSFQGEFKFETIPALPFIVCLAMFFSFLTSFKWGKRWEVFFFEKSNYLVYQHIALTVFSIVLFILCIGAITSSGFNPFIYFRF